MILAISYLLIGLFASILVFIKKPKIEFQIPKEFEQLEKDIAEWLELPVTPIGKEIPSTTSLDMDIGKYPLDTTLPIVPNPAFSGADHLQTIGWEVM